MSNHVTIGAVIEIPTSNGLAYVQYTHEIPRYGQVLRVLPGLYERQPDDVCRLAEGPQRLWVLVEIASVTRLPRVMLVSTCPIPAGARDIPAMKSPIDEAEGRPIQWWIPDPAAERGFRVVRTEDLSQTELSMPVNELWSASLLVRRLGIDWSPIDELDPRSAHAREATGPPDIQGASMGAGTLPVHAEQAVLLRVSGVIDDLSDLEDELASRAEAVGAEYDGHEFGPEGVILFLYGPDADRLAQAIVPVAKKLSRRASVQLTKRYGSPAVAEEPVRFLN